MFLKIHLTSHNHPLCTTINRFLGSEFSSYCNTSRSPFNVIMAMHPIEPFVVVNSLIIYTNQFLGCFDSMCVCVCVCACVCVCVSCLREINSYIVVVDVQKLLGKNFFYFSEMLVCESIFLALLIGVVLIIDEYSVIRLSHACHA